MDDLNALRRFVEKDSQEAFGEVVGRHVDLVYGAARRQLAGHGGNTASAEDVTQAVFLLLSRKAAGLVRGDRVPLAGWLLRATHFACKEVKRREARRRHHEGKAMGMRPEMTMPRDAEWEQISPVLDSALMRLGEVDRSAVALHCLEERTFAEVGSALGISEEAARKRVGRAIEKLRAILARRGIAAPEGLASMLALEAIVRAPGNVVATISTGAAAGKAGVIASGAGKLLAWSGLQGAMTIGAVIIVVVGVVTGLVIVMEGPVTVASASATLSATAAEKTTPVFGVQERGGQIVFRAVVVDETGRPAAGVGYRMFRERWPRVKVEAEGRADAQGAFAIGPVAPDPVGFSFRTVLVDAPGYAYAWWNPMSNEPLWEPMPLKLVRGTVVEGVVVDGAGHAVVGASVNGDLQSRDTYGLCSLSDQNGMSVKTDAGGRFRFERIPPDARMHLIVRHPYFATVSTFDGYSGDDFPIAAGTTDVEMRMAAAGRLQVQLVHDGQPVRKAGICIGATDSTRKHQGSSGETDAEGRVELRGLAEGKWNLDEGTNDPTEDEQRVVPTMGVAVKAGEARDVVLRYDEGVMVHGTVRDWSDAPAVGRTVDVSANGLGYFEYRSVRVDDAGRFAIRLIPGKYMFLVEEGHLQKEVNVMADGAGMVDLVLPKPRETVQGQLVDQRGAGVAGVVAVNGSGIWTDNAGHFKMQAYAPLHERVAVVAADMDRKLGAGFLEGEGVAAESGVRRVVLEPMGTITGRIEDGAGNRYGDAELTVLAVGTSEEFRRLQQPIWKMAIGADGQFRIAPVPKGLALDLVATRGPWQGEARVATLEAGEERDIGTVVIHRRGLTTQAALRRGAVAPALPVRDAKISGRIVDEHGNPMVGARVQAGDSDYIPEPGVTDLKGRFVIEGLAADREVEVRAWLTVRGDAHARVRSKAWRVRTGSEGVELRMDP